MAAILAAGKVSRKEQNLRPEQIEALRLKREPKDLSVTSLEQEDGEGNIEYKYRIKDPHPVRLQQLITQMKYRLSEGNGECFYYIGIEDNGYPKGLDPADLEASIATLHRMAASLQANVTLLHYLPAAWGRRAALLRVATSTAPEARHTDLRIAVAGSADAGKSTLVAVLTHGSDGRPMLDNGRGLARINVFRHKHEMQSGRTSSICHQLLGYDREGRVINYATPAATALTPAEITASAAKVLTFLDLGGHEKYLKTALYGMTALLPDYGLLCVCAQAGLGRIAREHCAVAVALEMPIAVVITKAELVRPERFAAVLAEVRQLVALTLQHESGAVPEALSQEDARRRVEAASPLVATEAEALASARVLCELHADSLASPTARGAVRVHVPIFAVSAVTGAGVPVLHAFLAALRPGAALKRACSVPLVPSPGASPGHAVMAGGSGNSTSGSGSRMAHAPSAPASSAATASAGAESSCGAISSGCSSGVGSPRAVADGMECGSALAAFDAVAAAQVVEEVEQAAAAAMEAAAETEGEVSVPPTPPVPSASLYTPPGAAAPGDFVHAEKVAAAAVAAVLGGGGVEDVRGGAGGAADAEAQAVHFQVDGTFEVEGVGYVLSGTLLSGVVRLGQQLALGPTACGGFVRVRVRQLQRSHVAVQVLRAGQTATIAISPVEEHQDTIAVAVAVAEGQVGKQRGGSTAVGKKGAGFGNGGNGSSGGGFGGFGEEMAQLPLASSPGMPPAVALAPAAAATTGLGMAMAAAYPASGGLSGGFDDALAAAQDALDLCLEGADCADDETGAADDELFAFDAPDSPGVGGGAATAASRSPALSGSAGDGFNGFDGFFAGSHSGSGGGGVLPLSVSLCQLHSTTSVSVAATAPGDRAPGTLPGGGAAPGPGLSSSAPTRSLSMGAVGGSGSGSPSPLLLGDAMVSSRKGAVLLEPALQPRTSWTFEAVLLLLGGHWPPRGLLSGCWPPACEEELEGPIAALGLREAATSGGEQAGGAAGERLAGRRSRQRSAGGGTYVTVVHCGSVRQPAQVLTMQELQSEDPGQGAGDSDGRVGRCCDELRISASTRAAAALLHSARAQPGSPTGAAAQPQSAQSEENQDLGCLVRVVLRWQHRAEWLREGAKLLVRDRCDGRVAGAGFIRRVL